MAKASGLEAIPGCLWEGRGICPDFAGTGLGLADDPGAPVFSRSSAWTSMPAKISIGKEMIKDEEVGRTFLQQDPLEQRVLISQHQTLICRAAMALLQALQGLLIALDGSLELTDILRTTFTEGSLGLSVALLPFLRGSINLG